MRQPARIKPGLTSLPHIFYGWRLVGISVFTLAIISGSSFQGLGTFFVALERQFGWSRALLAGAFSLSLAEGALLGPIEGILVDRLGARRIIFIGLLMLGVGFIALSFVQSIVSFYAVFLIIYAGAGLGGYLPLMTTINHWFARRRTTAMAIGMTGFNVGGLLVPALAWTVASAGWQSTAMGIGLGICAMSIPVALLVRNRPEEYGLRPDDDPPSDTSAEELDASQLPDEEDGSFTVREAIQTSAFWFITLSQGFAITAIVAISVHIMPALTDMGMSLPMAGTVVATYTFTGVIFQLVGGFIGDRFPKPPVIAIFTAFQATGMLVAATMQTAPQAFIFAILFGIGLGGRVPLLTAIRGDYFGRKNFATILGISQLPMNTITIAAPIFAGYLFDVMDSYFIPFLGFAMLNFLGAAIILPARKPLRRLQVNDKI